MNSLTAKEIDHLVSQFQNRTLPKAVWTHEAHLVVAIWHHFQYEFDEALDEIKDQIKAYNLAVGTPNTDTSGYHETLTTFWMVVTKRFLLTDPDLEWIEACQQFLGSEFADNRLPETYYTSERLFSVSARKSWRNGDLQPISLKSDAYSLGNHFDLSDAQFLQEFTACTLPPSQFSHEAHLRLAWLRIRELGLDDAITNVCEGIIQYVEHLGAKAKYHHTLTVAAVRIVHHFQQKSVGATFEDFMWEYPQLKTNFRRLLHTHYSPDLIGQPEAREVVMEPDLLAFG
ncbi:hypothetical protein [Pontibacter sp. G13]|uniref:hypothetical protein n=1 Tax=Pontibacter sp. G13 TaxID=3074898 RepID=UPI00288C0665|nr:hypothetical protein [Pontibacter sp. G13]WNJ19360.1 hypothetical protein RJD25_02610 [Pontibacter sp. G13]